MAFLTDKDLLGRIWALGGTALHIHIHIVVYVNNEIIVHTSWTTVFVMLSFYIANSCGKDKTG